MAVAHPLSMVNRPAYILPDQVEAGISRTERLTYGVISRNVAELAGSG
jgi:hypothetical protein